MNINTRSKDMVHGAVGRFHFVTAVTQHAIPTTIGETAAPVQGLPESGLETV